MTYAINVSHAFNGESAKRTPKHMQTARLCADFWYYGRAGTAATIARSEHERPTVLARRRRLARYWNRASRNVADRRLVRKS